MFEAKKMEEPCWDNFANMNLHGKLTVQKNVELFQRCMRGAAVQLPRGSIKKDLKTYLFREVVWQ